MAGSKRRREVADAPHAHVAHTASVDCHLLLRHDEQRKIMTRLQFCFVFIPAGRQSLAPAVSGAGAAFLAHLIVTTGCQGLGGTLCCQLQRCTKASHLHWLLHAKIAGCSASPTLLGW